MKPGSKEYHALKSREHYQRRIQDPEWRRQKAEYRRQYRLANKRKAVEMFGDACNHCKQQFPDCVYEFHHTNFQEKETTPALLFNKKWEDAQEELNKCIMLCANCHRIEHFRLDYDYKKK